jgi:hypothetical protein
MKRIVLVISFLLAVALGAIVFLCDRSPRTGDLTPAAVPRMEQPPEAFPLSPVDEREASGRHDLATKPMTWGGESGYVSGVVVDLSETPIPGAECRVFRSSAPVLRDFVSRAPPSPEAVAQVQTDADGRFRLAVDSGFWVLRVNADGMSPWEGGSLQAGDFRWIRLQPARRLVIDVVNESGEGIAGAEVRLIEGRYSDPGQAVASVRTNGNGRTVLDALPSGTWYVHVNHTDYVGAVEPVAPLRSGRESMEVRLVRGIRIVGRVSLTTGAPPPQPARVLFETLDGNTSSHDVEVGPDGRYASRTVFPVGDSLEVAAVAPGLGDLRKEVTLAASGPSGEEVVDFVLEALERSVVGRVVDPQGQALDGVEVHVRPLVFLPTEPIKISPLDIVTGLLPNLSGREPQTSPVSRPRRTATTNADGRFLVRGLNPRRAYSLLLVSELHSNALLWIEEGEPGTTTDLGTVQLKAAGRIWGYVRRPDGSAIEGAEVHTVIWTHLDLGKVSEDIFLPVERPDVLKTLHRSITDDDGLFSIQPYPEGEFYLMCLGTQYGPYTVPPGGPIEIVAQDTARADDASRIPVVISVVDDTLSPVPSAYALLRPHDPQMGGASSVTSTTWNDWDWSGGDADGRIELFASSPGSYWVDVRDLRGQLEDQFFSVEVPEDGLEREVVLNLALDPSGPLAGVVQTIAGEGLHGIQVALEPMLGEISCNCLPMKVVTDATGSFSFGSFRRGNHRLVLMDPHGRFHSTCYYPARPGEPIVVTMQ